MKEKILRDPNPKSTMGEGHTAPACTQGGGGTGGVTEGSQELASFFFVFNTC